MSSRPDLHAARRLLTDVVDSFEKLEVVLHVHRTGYAAQAPEQIAAAVSVPLDEVKRCLAELAQQRVLERDGPWADAVAGLAHMYEEDRLEVMNLMNKTALARVRKEAARVFADALVQRPKKS